MSRETALMRPYLDRRDSFAPSVSPACSMSVGGSFDSSFSSTSSTDSWGMLSTPTSTSSRRQSCDSFDLEGLSSSQTSIASSPSHTEFLNMTSMTQNMLSGVPDQHLLYSTPCSKGSMGHSMMSFDFQYANTMYSPFDSQDYSPTLMFDNSSSPIEMPTTPSPHYVDPTQTFLQPYQAATPVETPHATPRTILASSPPEAFAQAAGQMRYFITPNESPCRSAQSSRTFFSSEGGSPHGNLTLESSAALHRIQGSTRVRKSSKKSQNMGSGIVHVAAGLFRCDWPNCESKHAFKRQEHLKRHKKTHMAQKDLHCRYCHKKFQQDRSDNYRSHVKLHADPDKKGSRTKYFPEAAEEVASWAKDRARGERLAPAAQIGRSSARRSSQQ